MSMDKLIASEVTKAAVKKSETFLKDLGLLIKNHPYKVVGAAALAAWLYCKIKPSDDKE